MSNHVCMLFLLHSSTSSLLHFFLFHNIPSTLGSLYLDIMAEAPKHTVPSSQTTDEIGSGYLSSPTSPMANTPLEVLPLSTVLVVASSTSPPPSAVAPSLAALSPSEVSLGDKLKSLKKRKGAGPNSTETAPKGRKTTEGFMAVPSGIPDLVPTPRAADVLLSPNKADPKADSKDGPQLHDEDQTKESSLSESESSDPEFKVVKRRYTRSAAAASLALPKTKSKGTSKATLKKSASIPLKASSSKSKGTSSTGKDANVPLPPNRRAPEVTPIPPSTHFVNTEARTLFASCTISRPIVYEKSIEFSTMLPSVKIFVNRLGWVKALESFPRVNLTMVHEFYANFPENISADVKLKSKDPIHVFVRGIHVDISPSKIRQVLSLPQTEKSIMPQVKKFISEVSLDDLAASLYSTAPSEPVSECFLSSQYMTEWYKTMGFLARTMLTPTTQTSKIPHQQAALISYFCTKGHSLLPAEYYMYQAIRKAAIPQRHAIKSSLVFPALITLLCVDAGVQVWDKDVILAPIPPVDRLTIAKSSAQSTFYVESLEHTLLKKEIKKTLDLAIATAITEVKATISDQFADLKTTLKGMLGQSARPTAAGDSTSRVPPAGNTYPEDTSMAGDDPAALEGESSDEAISGDGDDDQSTEAALDDVVDDSV